ncbi:MAG: helix-turn-helix domain-containing protein [Oscillospiraceae bacterium]|jgi:putative transcriptional regulator|nr:helix-turn-helix domain-containing protein [Oscillospiraceae bacterium]
MFIDNLKTLRKAKGLSQEELAIRLNVVRQTVSKWEKGLSVPDADLLVRIAEIFEVPVSELLGVRIENEKEIGDIAEQLSRINEQLAVQNRRARRVWRTTTIVLAVIFALLLLLFTIFRNDASDENCDELYSELTDTLEWKSSVEFFYTQDGMYFLAAANRLAMAWLRGDIETVTYYMLDPEYELGYLEDSGNILDEVDYMFLLIDHPNFHTIENTAYPAIYRIRLKGEDTVFFIEMGLIKTANGWRAEWIYAQK